VKNSAWSRRLLLGCAATVMLLTAGDSALTQVVTSFTGIDPLAILDLQVKPNVLIMFDSSGSMGYLTTTGTAIGGDDPASKMYQLKDAVNQVITANTGKIRFGLASYGVLNQSKFLSWDNAGNQQSGLLTYVSIDANAATWTGSTGTRYFATNTTNNYLGTTAANVYNSFGRFNMVLDGPGCTSGACRRYLFSQILRNNKVFRFNTGSTTGLQSGYPAAFTCPNPPAGLFPQDPNVDSDPTTSDIKRACFKVESTATGNPGAIFYYTSGLFDFTGTACTAAARLAPVAGCAEDNTDTIKAHLKPSMPVTGCSGTTEGLPCGLGTYENNTSSNLENQNPLGATSNTDWGLVPGQNTPLAGFLDDVRNNFSSYFPGAQATGQRNFVLMLTDGDETCNGNPAASALANWNSSPRIETLVVGVGLNTTTLNAIARNGSGNARDAYQANNTADLVNVLNQALQQTATVGEFSDQMTITGAVYEYGPYASLDPFDPTHRYDKLVPLLTQSTFEVPGYYGHLNAYVNNAGASQQVWDAGDKLCRQVTGFPATTGSIATDGVVSKCNITGTSATAMGNQAWTFANMTGTNNGPPTFTQSTGRLKRRIFTTSRNGVYAYGTGVTRGADQVPIPLWPPTTDASGVDPDLAKVKGNNTYPKGSLDVPLGIASLDFATLQSTFHACQGLVSGTTSDTDCSDTTIQTDLARKEAREMILAYTAGASLVVDVTGTPVRQTDGSLQYRAKGLGLNPLDVNARPWILGDATLSGAALITVPAANGPTAFHSDEFNTLLVQGPHQSSLTPYSAPTNQIDLGFGLRNPDLDNNPASKATSLNDLKLKPVMSVVYYGANDMLHAFRAGPCATATKNTSCTETGGEELWGFVPYDQLGKLKLLLTEGQSRANHKYMIATALRFGDVFVPGTYTDPSGTSRTGKWRRFLFFGRGIGGSYYTVLDVTNPGVFTQTALTTNPALPVWNRGNPDTQDGTTTGTKNYVTNPGATDLGVTDFDAYATVGQSWSVPVLSRVNPATNAGLDFMIYMGSGYGAVSTQGHNFYSVNPLTGDVITSADVGTSSTSGAMANAIVADPAVFNAAQLKYQVTHSADTIGSQVYVGDLYGRLWRFMTDTPSTADKMYDFGVTQPIANAVALLNYSTDGGTTLLPHIFLETGNDRRLSSPSGGFLLAALRDEGTPPAKLLYSFALPSPFRGTSQPATALTATAADASARVFFVATAFNPVTVSNCSSSFDSRIYMVGAGSGKAAYDVNGDTSIDNSDLYLQQTGSRVNRVQVAYGTLMVDQGLGAQKAPPPPQPPVSDMTGQTQMVYVRWVNPAGSPVCR
jgi:hypothetical protein